MGFAPYISCSQTLTSCKGSLNTTSASKNCWRMLLKTVGELTLRVLWRFTGLLETGFLALNCTCITSQEACFLQRAAVVLAINFVECTSDTQANGTGLTGWSATVNQSDDVIGA